MKPRTWSVQLECVAEDGVAFWKSMKTTEEFVQDAKFNLLHKLLDQLESEIRRSVEAAPGPQEAP